MLGGMATKRESRIMDYVSWFGGCVPDGRLMGLRVDGSTKGKDTGHRVPTVNLWEDTAGRVAAAAARRDTAGRVPGVALKEEFVGARVSGIRGEGESVTKVCYFKGNDPSKWKSSISTYELVNLGEIYEGVELKLKAHGNNVEKLLYVKPGADPDQIKISLSGVNDCGVRNAECGIACPKSKSQNPKLQINPAGQLEVETALGTVAFTKPIAYQEIDGKRVEVDVEYRLSNPNSKIQIPKSEYCFTVASYDKTKDLIIDPLLASTFLGGSSYEGGVMEGEISLTLDTSGNVYVTGVTGSSDFPTTSGAYDTSFNGGGDVFVSKLNSGLTGLLASTYLGGSGGDGGAPDGEISLTLDTSGNVYVTGRTGSSDFPTTSGAYDTSFNGGYDDVFVSKLDSGLTSLLASTLLGGSNGDRVNSLTLDTSGNVYVTGGTVSTDFPTTSGAYDTSFNGGYADVFVSKLNSGLTSLLASTYLGGYNWDHGSSLTLDTSGNVYVTGYTDSSNFPTTSGAYDTSSNGSSDVFVSKLNSGLTGLLASTFLGGSSSDWGNSLTLDTSGNVYVTGKTWSSNFPTTSGAYDTSFNGSGDVFVSKLNSGLTGMLASTYLGGSGGAGGDYGCSLALNTSGNVYVTGVTWSTDFPTTSGAYDTSFNGSGDVFVSKLDSGLTSLLASTFLGGFVYEGGMLEGKISLTIDTGGNIYVAGVTGSPDFPTTSGAYQTALNGFIDVFVSKLDGNLSAGTAQPPTVTTGDAADITLDGATLKGVVNANGLTATAWFEYGDTSGGPYSNTNTQTVTGSSDTPVSHALSGLSACTKYYYRLVAENTAGKSEGSEKTFTTSSTTFVQSPPFGLTIITHGYQSGTDEGGWVNEMARAIASKFGGITKIPIYTMKIYEDFTASMTPDEDVPPGLDFRTAGGAIIKVDWSDLDGGEPLGCIDWIPTGKVADAIFKNISDSWYRVPIHLIGHSRGASVNTRLAYDLGSKGIWVDHFTSLDPQPITSCGDAPIKIYKNILFADNNYRDDGVLPRGESVAGTYQRSLNGIVTGDGEYCNVTAAPELPNGSAHSQVHTYYHGTISHKNDDGKIWYDDCVEHIQVQPKWYTPFNDERHTGYYFSRIEMSDRYSDTGQFSIFPKDGLHYKLSGSDNNRVPLKLLSIAWPNVTFKPFANQCDYEVRVGEKVVFTYYYQDADNSNLDIRFNLDNDTNPFNNSDNKYYYEIGRPKLKTKRSDTISDETKFDKWVPTSADIGTHYVQIKATDHNKQVRYDYLLKPINVQSK